MRTCSAALSSLLVACSVSSTDPGSNPAPSAQTPSTEETPGGGGLLQGLVPGSLVGWWTPPEPQDPPTLAVTLIDAPGDFQSVPVVIDRVEACGVLAEAEDEGGSDTGSADDTGEFDSGLADSGEPDAAASTADEADEADEAGCSWFVLADEASSWDLLALQDGVKGLLGTSEIAPGRYEQIRLLVSEAAVVVDDVTHQLDIPSGENTGLKLSYDFEIGATGDHELRLDWDAHASIRQRGNGDYFLTPVVTVDYFGPAESPETEEEDSGLPETVGPGSDDEDTQSE